MSRKGLLYIILVVAVVMTFVYGPSVGVSFITARSESNASTSTASIKNTEYEPDSAVRIRVETDGLDPQLMTGALEEALSETASHGMAFDVVHEDSENGETPLLVVLLTTKQSYLGMWATAQVTTEWYYSSNGVEPSDPEWTSMVMDSFGPLVIRHSSGAIDTRTVAYGLFTRRYHESQVAEKIASELRNQLVGQLTQ